MKGKKLTEQEQRIFDLLESNEGKVVPRSQILNTMWGVNEGVKTRIVDVYIGYLRQKIGPSKIISSRGIGYAYVRDPKLPTFSAPR